MQITTRKKRESKVCGNQSIISKKHMHDLLMFLLLRSPYQVINKSNHNPRECKAAQQPTCAWMQSCPSRRNSIHNNDPNTTHKYLEIYSHKSTLGNCIQKTNVNETKNSPSIHEREEHITNLNMSLSQFRNPALIRFSTVTLLWFSLRPVSRKTLKPKPNTCS